MAFCAALQAVEILRDALRPDFQSATESGAVTAGRSLADQAVWALSARAAPRGIRYRQARRPWVYGCAGCSPGRMATSLSSRWRQRWHAPPGRFFATSASTKRSPSGRENRIDRRANGDFQGLRAVRERWPDNQSLSWDPWRKMALDAGPLMRIGMRESPSWPIAKLKGRIRFRRLFRPTSNIACGPGGPYVSARSLLMGANDGAVDQQMLIVAIGCQSRVYALSCASMAPAAETPIRGLPFAIALRQVAPVGARSQNPQTSDHEQAVIRG